jgi:hypothetical protein
MLQVPTELLMGMWMLRHEEQPQRRATNLIGGIPQRVWSRESTQSN